MGADFLLMIDGIKGESVQDKHKDEIEVESFSWGASQQGAHGGGGGGGAGKVSFQDLHFTSRVGKHSPLLVKACATGQHIKKAVLTVRKSGGDQQEYYKVTLEDLLVSSYQSGGAKEQCLPWTSSPELAKIEFAYSPQKPDGKLDAPVIAKYALKESKS